MRRGNMANAISIVEAPKPSDTESEASYAIDARQKLEDAIEDQKSKAEAAEIEFAKTFARGLRLVPVVDADGAVQKNGVRKAVQDRAQQRIEALESILEVVKKVIDQLKYESPDAVNSALTRKVEALEKAVAEKEAVEKGLYEQIKKLKTEISHLSKAAARKSA